MRRGVCWAGSLLLLLSVQVASTNAGAAVGPLFRPPRVISTATAGPWDFAYPVGNLNGYSIPDQTRGLRPRVVGDATGLGFGPPGMELDLALISCPASAPPGCPVTNTFEILRGDGRGNFTSVQQAHAGSYPTGIASGDFNGDRRLDVAITDPTAPGSTAPSLVYIYLQSPSGTFVHTQTYTLAGPQTRSAQAGDVNRDGKLDLVVGEGTGLQVLRGRGDSTFDVLGHFGTCAAPHFFKGFADFDRNGAPDFAIACAGGSSVAVFLNDGTGSFTQKTLAGIQSAHNVGLADFNSDGNTDLVTTSRTGVWVYLGDGRGNFSPAPGAPYNAGFPPGTNNQMTFLVTGHFASPTSTQPDLIPDVAVVNSSVNFSTSSVSVLVGRPDGSLVNASNLGSPFQFGAGTAFNTWGLSAGDFNSDNKMDLAVAGGVTNRNASQMTLLIHS